MHRTPLITPPRNRIVPAGDSVRNACHEIIIGLFVCCTLASAEIAESRKVPVARSSERVVVLTIHGVPDTAHPHVNTPPELFAEYMQFLHDDHYTVIAMRELMYWRNMMYGGGMCHTLRMGSIRRDIRLPRRGSAPIHIESTLVG